MAEPLRAIDSSVVLRYALRDNLDQWQQAIRLIESSEPLGLTAVVLAEVAWTLTGPQTRRDRASVADFLVGLLDRENIIAVGFDKVEAQAALHGCGTPIGAADFGDALIAACARSAGIDEIYSFDRRFARAGLIPLIPG